MIKKLEGILRLAILCLGVYLVYTLYRPQADRLIREVKEQVFTTTENPAALLTEERQEETESQLSYWLLLAVNHIAAAMMTSMGAFLTAMLFGITALVAAIRYRSWSILWKTALCCIPNVVYLVLLLVL